MDERGVALLNTTIDYGLRPVNRYFDQLKQTFERMNVQVHEFNFRDLLDPRIREKILNTFSTMAVSGNGGNGPNFIEVPEFQAAYGFILKFKGKGLFICRASQFYLMESGAKLENGIFPERGLIKTVKVADHTLLAKLDKNFDIYGDHHQRIDLNTLPSGFKVLASSENCKVSIVEVEGKSHFTTQNHPEIATQVLLQNFLFNLSQNQTR